VLISASSRATLGNTCFAGACARIGAQVSLGGLIEPAHTLALLSEPRRLAGKKTRVSAVSIYPSYLGELVTSGLRLGYRPNDFSLERIFTGGEIVTAGLKARCQALFGAVQFIVRIWYDRATAFGGTLYPQGHLHFDPAHGLLEVVDPATGTPARVGDVGTIVATPFAPFRETTILLRYNTQDVVRQIAEPLICSLRHLPATTNRLGKQHHTICHDAGWIFPRDILEALEEVENVTLPTRCGFWAVPGGVTIEVVANDTRNVRRMIEQSLDARCVPVQALHLAKHHSRLRHPLPLRCDLREACFSQPVTRQPAELAGELVSVQHDRRAKQWL
jgi:phenylacetate-CoA ligase